MTGLYSAVGDGLGVGQGVEAARGHGTQAQVVLEHPPEQLAATTVELGFKLGMAERRSVGPSSQPSISAKQSRL